MEASPGGRSPVSATTCVTTIPGVKDPRVWQILSQDLGPLKAAVATMLRAVEEAGPERT